MAVRQADLLHSHIHAENLGVEWKIEVFLEHREPPVLRLTIADALGSTVVLDDQLVQSDASRMDWLRAFMMECADRSQILVHLPPGRVQIWAGQEEVGIQVGSTLPNACSGRCRAPRRPC